MPTFLTSDDHFNHERIIQLSYRPFQTVEEMNETLINNWNSVVDHSDLVYVLGDIAMGQRAKTLELVRRLNGFKVLLPGNHDYCHPMHAKDKKYQAHVALYNEYFDAIMDVTEALEDLYLMSHMPYNDNPDGLDLRERDYSEWYPKDEGKILLHGHVHEQYKHAWSSRGSLMINVGVDVWDYTPVSLDELKELAQNLIRNRNVDVSSNN